MNLVGIIVAVMVILGLVPLFIVFGIAWKDLWETQKHIKQNERKTER